MTSGRFFSVSPRGFPGETPPGLPTVKFSVEAHNEFLEDLLEVLTKHLHCGAFTGIHSDTPGSFSGGAPRGISG